METPGYKEESDLLQVQRYNITLIVRSLSRQIPPSALSTKYGVQDAMIRRWTILCLLLAVVLACTVDIGAPQKGARIRIVSDITRTDTIDAGPSKPIVIEISDSTGRLENQVTANIAGAPTGAADGGFSMLVLDQNGSPSASISEMSSGQATFQVIFGRRAGQAAIVISVPELKLVDTVWFTVRPGAPAQLALRPSDSAVTVGGSYQQSAMVVDRAGNDLNVSSPFTYSTADPTVTLSAAGQVTGIAYGRAGIKVSYASLTGTAMVSVVPSGRLATVPPPIGLTDASVAVLATDGSGFRRYATPQDASGAVWSADATRIYYVGTSRGGPQTQRIYSLTLADGASSPLISDTVTALSGQRLASPAVSYDGAWIYFITQLPFSGPPSGDIWRVHPDGTALARLVTGQVVRKSPSPSPDGTRLAYVEETTTGNDIRILNLQSGGTLAIRGSGADEIRWSPTGDRIAINGSAGLSVVNADGSQLTQLVRPASYFTGLDWSPDGRWIVATPGGVPTILEPTATGLRLPLSFRGVGQSWSSR